MYTFIKQVELGVGLGYDWVRFGVEASGFEVEASVVEASTGWSQRFNYPSVRVGSIQFPYTWSRAGIMLGLEGRLDEG
eukprot:1108308-Amorphochlora_amoeboformis.AAC.2